MIDDSPLIAHARRELELAGLFDADADYGGAPAQIVMQLVEVLAGQGLSGGSHGLVMALFNQVATFKPLTPLTSEPAEWIDRSEISGEPMWQNRRDSAMFSRDGGQTWYNVQELTPSGRLNLVLDKIAQIASAHVVEGDVPALEVVKIAVGAIEAASRPILNEDSSG